MATARGGLMRVVEVLAGEQARRHDVLVVSPLPPGARPGTRAVPWQELRLAGNSDLGGHLRLRELLRRDAPDVAILHAGSPGELAVATAVASGCCTTVVLEHAPEHYPLRRPWRDAVLSLCKRQADRWLCVSRAGAHHLQRLWHLQEGTPAVLYSGVPPPSLAAPDAALTDVVLGAGRTLAEKGYDTFRAVAAMASGGAKARRFVWIGADAQGRDGEVELLPWREDLGPALSACGVLLLPSRVEGLPLLLLEAWAAGAPVVASAVGGLPEVVRDGSDGLLVAAGDAARWSRAVAGLLGDESFRKRLAAAGHARWRQEFTASAMAARWEVVLGGLETDR